MRAARLVAPGDLGGWRRAASPAGRRGALRGVSGRTGGAASTQGGGAVCTMSYPGHPGAGGGYYPGGVSAAGEGTATSRLQGLEGATDAREEAPRADPDAPWEFSWTLTSSLGPTPFFFPISS